MKIRSLLVSAFLTLVVLARLDASGQSNTPNLLIEIGVTNSGVLLKWTEPSAALESSLVLTGGWDQIPGAASPWVISPTNPATFFRLRGVVTEIPTFDFLYLAPSFNTSIGDPIGCGCTSQESPTSLASPVSAQDNAEGALLLHTGEVTQNEVDLEIRGRGFNWRFERRYRSGMNYDGPLGHGWDFNHNHRLVMETNGNIRAVNGLGRVDRYTLITNGIYAAPSGFYTRLTRNLDGTFLERDRHGSTNFFSTTNVSGIARLTRISDRNGNQMQFQYNAFSQLTNVVDTLGRNISYSYNADGRLTNIMDFTGRALRFSYDAQQDLVSVTTPPVIGTPNGNDFPNGKTTLYTYANGFGDGRFNHNLLAVTAPNETPTNGPARLIAQYETNSISGNADRVVSLALGGINDTGTPAGGSLGVGYQSLGTAPPNNFTNPVALVTVTNRAGNVALYSFNQLGNVVRSVRLTRGLRVGEPVGFTNSFVFNADGQMLARTNGERDVVLFTFNVTSPDRLQQGNLLQTRWLPGPRGSAFAQIIVSNTFNTNFNFVATRTDAATNITSYTYDSRGNVLQISHPLTNVVDNFEYNAFGQQAAHVHPANAGGHRRRDEWQYYASGPQAGWLQSRTIDATNLNLTTTYEYDSRGNVTRVIGPLGDDTLFTYNSLDQLMRESSCQVSTPSGLVRYVTDLSYDANGNLIQMDAENRDETGAVVATNTTFTTTYTYDILGRRIRTAQEMAPNTNRVTTFAYDANGNLTRTQFGEANAGRQTNNAVETIFDERDLPFRVIGAPGDVAQSTDQLDYDFNGNLIRSSAGIENSPRVGTARYDGYNRLIAQTNAMGNADIFTYDIQGNLVGERQNGQLIDVPGSVGNIRLAETIYTYDALNRLVQQDRLFFNPATTNNISGGHAISKVIYSPNSQIVQSINANGHSVTNAYDTANRLSQVIDGRSNRIAYAYDANGCLITQTETDQYDLGGTNRVRTTTYSYDGVDRLIQTVDNLGITNRWAYDSRGNRVKSTDGRDNVTRYEYDGLNRLITTIHVLTTDGIGSNPIIGNIVNRQTWDDSSRLTSQQDDNLNTTTYVYDALDRLVTTGFADGTSSSITYDVHGNPVTMLDANGSVITSTFDALNRLTNSFITRAANIVGVNYEQYQYDGLSRIVRAENDDSIVTRAYDSLSSRMEETQRVLPDGAMQTVTCTHDGEGNRLTTTYPGGRVLTNYLDNLDRLERIADVGGTLAQYSFFGEGNVQQMDFGNNTRTTFNHDVLLRPTQSMVKYVPGNSDVDSRLHVWNPAHQKVYTENLLNPIFDHFGYTNDSVGRLTKSITTSSTQITYALDGVGNRLSISGNPNPGSYFMSLSSPPADAQMNQYTATHIDTRTYDLNGNLTNTGLHYYEYDYENQLVAAWTFNGSTYTNNFVAKYDCLGRRIEKATTTEIVRYYYDGLQEIEEQDFFDNTIATHVWGQGIDDLVSTDRSGQRRFFHADDLGSVRAATDSSGSVVERYRYDDYGAPTFMDPGWSPQPGSSIGNSTLFTGRRYDGDTGLYYYRTRYFEPAVGRFTTRDSIGIWGDENNLGNAYTYVGNDPATAGDPSGEAYGNYNSVKSNTSLAATGDDEEDSSEYSGPMYAASINTSRSNLKDKASLAAAGDGIGGVETGFKKRPGGQLYAASINTSRSNLKDKASLAASGPSGGGGGTTSAASINTSRSNLKDKAGIAAAGDGIGGVEVGLKKKPGGQLSAAAFNTSRSNLKDKASLAAAGPSGGGGGTASAASFNTSRSNLKDKASLAAAGPSGGGGGTTSAASFNTSRSNLKDKAGIAAAGDGIGGVEVGLKKKPGGQLSAAAFNTSRSNLKDKATRAASINTSRSNLKDKASIVGQPDSEPPQASSNYNSAKSNTF